MKKAFLQLDLCNGLSVIRVQGIPYFLTFFFFNVKSFFMDPFKISFTARSYHFLLLGEVRKLKFRISKLQLLNSNNLFY